MTIAPLRETAPSFPVPHDVINEGPWWQAWNFDPHYLLPLVLLGFFYVRGLRRWPERSREHRTWRTVSYLGGLVLLAFLFESPLDRLGEHHFSMHMIQHNLVMMVVPPLLLLGAPTTPILRGLPRGLRQEVVVPTINHPAVQAVWRVLTFPPLTVAIFVMLQWLWHLAPGWYDRALNDNMVHDLQHISFFGIAMLFWWNMIDPAPRSSRVPMGARILYFYAAMLPKHILAAMIVFADEPFYPTYERVKRFLPGTPLEDQQLAGLIMWVPLGEALNLFVAAMVFVVWFRQSEHRQREKDAERDAMLLAASLER